MTSQQTTVHKKAQRNLLFAVLKGDKSAVEELLKQKPELSAEALGRILWQAVRNGAMEIAVVLVEAGADVNLTNPFDKSGTSIFRELLSAKNLRRIDQNSVQLAVLMAERGADVNVCDSCDKSFLNRAIAEGVAVDAIKKLVEHGARVNKFAAEIFRHPDAATIVPWLLDRQSFVGEGGSERAAEALSACCRCGRSFSNEKILVWVRTILDMGFPVEALDRECTLYSAVKRGNLELVQLLVEYGFDITRPVYNGFFCTSPLGEALGLSEPFITELLIRRGAKINDPLPSHSNNKIVYPIHRACSKGSVENIKVLLRHGADISVIDSKGRTPFSVIKYCRYMTKAHRIVIKQLAFLVSKEKKIHDRDLTIIANDRDMHSWYTQCLKELEMMKTFNVINDIAFFSFFREDIRELLFKTRNYDLVENLDAVKLTDQFPVFHKEMALTFENVRGQKEWFGAREEAVYDALEDILPDVPMDKIVYYLYLNNIVD